MADEYIKREDVNGWIEHMIKLYGDMTGIRLCAIKNDIEAIPAADVVSREAFDQVMWERDVAIAQLAEVGKSLGERMDDVCRVGSYGDCGCGIKDGAGECCRKNVLTEEGG